MKVTSKYLYLNIVTANLLHNQPPSHPRSDIEWMKSHWDEPDIIGCQESDDYHAVLRSIPDYGFADKGKSNSEVSIIYNKKTMRLVSVKAHFMVTGNAHHDPPRYVMEGHFVTKTDGMHVYYFNTHADHGIDSHGNPGHPRTENNVYVHKATVHFTKMARLVSDRAKQKNSVVFWGGDLNVAARGDAHVRWQGFPHAIFSKVGMHSIYDELDKMFPGRVIDVIGSCVQDPGVKASSMAQSPSTVHSDHRFVKAVYRLTRGKTSGGGDSPDTPSRVPNENPPFPDPDLPEDIPIPALPLDPVVPQTIGGWDHSVCCKKNS